MPTAEHNAATGTRYRVLTTVGALLGCALLLAGCATMPDNGDVSRVSEEPRTDSDPQVQVFGVQPQKGESAQQIVHGFMEATTSDEANYQTAKKYLTGKAARDWDPFKRIAVVSGAPLLSPVRSGADGLDPGVSFDVSGQVTADVDGKNAYTPASGTYDKEIHVSLVGGQWRIDSLPNGLVLGESDFERIYRSVNMYYFADLGSQQGDPAIAREVLVADPLYVRRRIDPVTSSVRALLAGPSAWLQPVVDTEFPFAKLPQGGKLALDEDGRLTVPLEGLPRRVSAQGCQRMAAQLLYTVQDQSSNVVESVAVQHAGGSTVCVLSRQKAAVYSPELLTGRGDDQYYVDTQHRVESLPADGGGPRRVPGPFGGGQVQLRTVAVSRDEQQAAGVSSDGRTLFAARLDGSTAFKRLIQNGDDLTAPSWDGLNDLWVADHAAGVTGLWMWSPDLTQKIPVTVTGLRGGTIEGVRVAADGVRVALLVRRGGSTVLELGYVVHSGTEAHPVISVGNLRTVSPGLRNVDAASWAGESRLVVVGAPATGVQVVEYVDTDGSPAYTPNLPGIGKITAVAAFEDESRPLLVASKETMFRLPTDSDWAQVSSASGTAPVYPG